MQCGSEHAPRRGCAPGIIRDATPGASSRCVDVIGWVGAGRTRAAYLLELAARPAEWPAARASKNRLVALPADKKLKKGNTVAGGKLLTAFPEIRRSMRS